MTDNDVSPADAALTEIEVTELMIERARLVVQRYDADLHDTHSMDWLGQFVSDIYRAMAVETGTRVP